MRGVQLRREAGVVNDPWFYERKSEGREVRDEIHTLPESDDVTEGFRSSVERPRGAADAVAAFLLGLMRPAA